MSSSPTRSASPCVCGWLDCRCGCVRCRRVVHSVSSLILSDNVTFSRSTLKRIGAPNATQTFWPPALLMCCRDSRCFVSLFFFLPDNSLPEPPVQKMFSHYDTNRAIVRVDLDWELLFLSVGPDTPLRERALNQVSIHALRYSSQEAMCFLLQSVCCMWNKQAAQLSRFCGVNCR